MLNDREIEVKMKELARRLEYKYSDISWLKKAMLAEKIIGKDDGINRKNYKNDALATLGDSILKCILVEYFFDKREDKKYITDAKKEIEDNKTLFSIFNQLGLYEFAHNNDYFYGDAPEEKRVSNSNHNQYVEAIIGAIYKDKGFEYAKKWVINFLKNNEKLK